MSLLTDVVAKQRSDAGGWRALGAASSDNDDYALQPGQHAG